ncbi:MAG TPA: DUF2155 domain-containing protein [Alphaproteobacteria bacterium]|nr:DUF2155 domain-containing protein [Alphaproteobacteria bacterium]
MTRARLGLALLLAAAAGPLHAATFTDRGTAVLQSLDKVTARTSILKVPVGETQGFGTIAVTVRACRVTPPEEPPESAAFVEVTDTRTDAATVPAGPLFSGWMFASSPALSALEHPVYDVWVLGCE